jgi:predicted P-loop ATPase
MRDIGLNSVPWVQDTFVHIAYENTYHPIKEWFADLKWDGTDHIGHFTGQYLTETTGLGHAAFKRWFIGAVAKVYEHSQNFMLVWDGPQGIGKSMLARWLCPLPDYFIEGPIKPDDKDFQLRMCTKMVWEVSELQSTTRKADREALKGFITTQEVTVRKAYARYDTVKPSMVSMVGTINEDGAGFLTDPTGNRRFVIIRLERIDWNYTKLDVSRLWAQAVALYRQGEPWVLTPDETALQKSINAQYEMTSVLSTYFFEFYRVDPSNKEAYELTYEILQTLETAGLKGSQQANLNELSRLLKKLGAESFRARVDGKRPSAYRCVVRLEPAKLSI